MSRDSCDLMLVVILFKSSSCIRYESFTAATNVDVVFHKVMAYVVMAYIVMALYSYGRCGVSQSYGIRSYGIYSYGPV